MWKICVSWNILDSIPNHLFARPALIEAEYFDSLVHFLVDLDLNKEK